MKKTKFILDPYEQAIENALEKGEYVSVFEDSGTKLLKEAAQRHKDLQQTKRITLRVNKGDLIKLKAKANKHNIPYQRLINTLIRQYTENKTKIIL